MLSDNLKQKETLERMGKEQKHKTKKSEEAEGIPLEGHLYSWTLTLAATFLVFEIQRNGQELTRMEGSR